MAPQKQMKLPPGAELIDDSADVMKLPPGAELVSGEPDTPKSLSALDYHPSGTESDFKYPQGAPAGSITDTYLRPIANTGRATIRDLRDMALSTYNSAKQAVQSGDTGVVSSVKQAASDLIHPIDAHQRAVSRMGADAAAGQRVDARNMPAITEDQATQYAGDLVAQGVVAEATDGLMKIGGKAVGKIVPAAMPSAMKDSVRRVAQSAFGVGPRQTRRAAAELVRNRENQLEKTAGKNLEARENRLAAMRKQAQDHVNGVVSAEDKNRLAEVAHGKDVARTLQYNEGLGHVSGMREELEGHLDKATEDYFRKEDVVRGNAKTKENALWQPWHEKAINAEVDVDDLAGFVEKADPQVKKMLQQFVPSAEDAAPDSQYAADRKAVMKSLGHSRDYWDLLPTSNGKLSRATVDKIMEQSGFEPDPVDFNPERGKKMSLEQIHRAKSILGWNLARREYAGPIEGDMKQFYKKLTQAEERGSMAIEAKPELDAAKNATREYQEAFGRKRSPRTTVSDARKLEVNRSAVRDEEEEARLAAVAKHDPTLVEDYRRVQQLQDRVDQLPSTETLRKEVQQPPDPPTPGEVPQPKPAPAPAAQSSVPSAELNLQRLKSDRIQKVIHTWGDLDKYDIRRFAGTAIGGAAATFAGLMHAGRLGEIGAFSVGAMTPKIVASLLDKPGVMRWITEPTMADLEILRKVPGAERLKIIEGITGVAVEAAQSGKPVKVSAKVAEFLGQANVRLIAAAATVGGSKKLLNNRREALSLVQNPNDSIEHK